MPLCLKKGTSPLRACLSWLSFLYFESGVLLRELSSSKNIQIYGIKGYTNSLLRAEEHE
jgi:hypothetical protein